MNDALIYSLKSFLKIFAAPYLLVNKLQRDNKLFLPSFSIELNEIDKYRFGFFGELGYGLAVWWPYLNFISRHFHCEIKTIGLEGSAVFVKEFSSDHIEVKMKQGDGWGLDFNPWQKVCKEKLIVPAQKKTLSISGKIWITNSLAMRYDESSNYSILKINHCHPLEEFKSAIIINVKSHFNWNNPAICNFYSSEEISRICSNFPEKTIYLNAPKFFKEPLTVYFNPDFNELMERNKNLKNLDDIYKECKTLGEVNSKQISILKSAALVFASQGGNAMLALLCNDNVRILMRGGMDYPDYMSLSGIKKSKIKIAYEVDDLITN